MVKLNNGEDLNDETVNFCMNALNQHDKSSLAALKKTKTKGTKRKRTATHPRRVLCQTSFFMEKLNNKTSDGGIAAVDRWAARQGIDDVFKLKKMIIPINIGGTVKQNKNKTEKPKGHWTSIHVDFEKKTISYLNSLHGGTGTKYNNLVLKYLQHRHKEEHAGKEMLTKDWKLINCKTSTPQQDNDYDCGVFVCTVATYTILGLPVQTIKQQDMNFYRRRLAMDILKGKIEV